MGLDTFFSEALLRHFNYEPTECQQALFRDLGEFVANPQDGDIMVINGYAGTGKTTAVAAFISTMEEFHMRYVLLAPTGRSAKVLARYTRRKAFTVHKYIYRQKNLNGGVGEFSLDVNRCSGCYFIVDESSLIQISSDGSSVFGSGDLLSDLVSFVRQGKDCRLILIGDMAQLPPVGLDCSPALDCEYLESCFGAVRCSLLTDVVRQAGESGILYNATILRRMIGEGRVEIPRFHLEGFDDVASITGGELIDAISDAYDRYGQDETIILCRSNKRANRYNIGIRSTVLCREEQLIKGDKLMVVKNCYQFEGSEESAAELEFIANGDVATLSSVRIKGDDRRYGLQFADAILHFPDYNDIEIKAKIITDTLTSESPALDRAQQNALFEGVCEDYGHITAKRKRYQSVREDKYFNALQIKYAYAVTCHKAQGGQWNCVFIDNSFFRDDISTDDLKWLYTALTRAVEKVYFVNFGKQFFD